MQRSTFLTRLVLTTLVVIALTVSATAGTAKALNPDQTSVTTIVNTVYWDLDAFWIPSTRATVNYYNYYSGSTLIDYLTPCGSTNTSHGTQGFYCPPSEGIHLDFIQQDSNVRRFGDGSTVFWMAHEYGHHVEKLLSINFRAPFHELLADCFAGMYFNRGVNTSRKLKYNDYLEARNQIWALSAGDVDHGTPAQRLRAFDFGYRQVNRNVCIYGAAVQY